MQSAIKFLFILIFVQFFNAQASYGAAAMDDLGKELYKNVKKVDDTFYISKISGKDLWLAMERVDDHNYEFWKNYSKIQNNSRVRSYAGSKLSSDGSAHFEFVFNENLHKKNEVWVAYITRSNPPYKIKSDYYDNVSFEMNQFPDFQKNIEMFVTVTSTPSALITSHMGISVSLEREQIRTKGTSIDLHSFAAKVMLMRNPQRKYMINAPAFAMEEIILKELPKAVFVGTREGKEFHTKRAIQTLEDFKKENKEDILKQMREEAEVQFLGLTRDFNNYRQSEEKKNKTEAEIRKAFFDDHMKKSDYDRYNLIDVDADGNFEIWNKRIESRADREIEEKFKRLKASYESEAVSSLRKTITLGKYISLMKKYPPIISRRNGGFSIFNPEKPSDVWLSIDENNKEYDWMFSRPFQPAGNTHYIAVKLKDLADAKAIDPVQ